MKLVPPKKPIEYPDSDGKPMAENTLQFEWIVTIKGNLDILFADRPDVFVAGDLLWYPVEGHPEIRQAPDALVAFGRPKGYRGSYMQWVEDGVAPQVVFEILSPGNRPSEMSRKLKFYERYGVEEYYIFDPDLIELTGWLRKDGELQEIAAMNGWTSPRLGVRFELADDLTIHHPDGSLFLGFEEIARERKQAESNLKLATWEKDKAVMEKEKAVAEKIAAEALVREQADEIAQLRARLAASEKT